MPNVCSINTTLSTVFARSIRTDGPEQTVYTQIRRRIMASDQGLHRLAFIQLF